jgi:hypothetical protein
MRAVIATEYVTLDGVKDAPGRERFHDWGCTSADPRNREIAEAWASRGAMSTGRTRLVHRGGENVL